LNSLRFLPFFRIRISNGNSGLLQGFFFLDDAAASADPALLRMIRFNPFALAMFTVRWILKAALDSTVSIANATGTCLESILAALMTKLTRKRPGIVMIEVELVGWFGADIVPG
jgi:hypothetical protein